MSKKQRNKLTLEKIQQLLTCVGTQKAPAAEQTEAEQYDWIQPHFFSKNQLEKLNAFAQLMASAVAARFGQFLQSSFEVQVCEISQHYAEKFIGQIFENEQKDCYLILKGEKEVSCGLITVPRDTAASWLKLLLGESEAKEDTAEQLSQLERFLLCDMVCHLAEAITTTNRQLNLSATKNLLCDNFSLDIAASEELCKITFEIKQKDSEQGQQVHLVLPCSRFLPVIGKAGNKKPLTPEQVKNTILEHAKQLPVAVTARFPSTELKFEHILTLQKGDILMLDKKISEPLELIVEGKTRYQAQLAKSGGSLAVKIIRTNAAEQ